MPVNETVRLELTAEGELVVMLPTRLGTSGPSAELYHDLLVWNRRTQLGRVFDSNGVYALPDGARRSPDVSWVELSRWQALTAEEQEGLSPLAPDFAIELASPSDLEV